MDVDLFVRCHLRIHFHNTPPAALLVNLASMFLKVVVTHKIHAFESERCRINESGKQRHEEHIADRGHDFHESSQCGSFTDTCSKGTKKFQKQKRQRTGMGKSKKLPAWQESKVMNKREAQTIRVGQEIQKVQRANRIVR